MYLKSFESIDESFEKSEDKSLKLDQELSVGSAISGRVEMICS